MTLEDMATEIGNNWTRGFTKDGLWPFKQSLIDGPLCVKMDVILVNCQWLYIHQEVHNTAIIYC